jgi:quinone-modifying oxidoreductase subunit QmoB
MAEQDKIGVYICTGYGIGEALNVEALSKIATDEYKVAVCKTIPTCEPADLDTIRQDVNSEGLNKVLIAGYSPRVPPHADNLGEGVIVDRVNLREQVIWCQEPNHEDTQMMAEDYLRMGIVRLQKTKPAERFPDHDKLDKTILVVGGGIAGLTAALEAAKTGYEVVLVEKENELGGWMAKQHRVTPFRPPYRDLAPPDIGERIAAAKDHERITVYTGAEIAKIVGGPGMFDVSLKKSGESANGLANFKAGAIIQATGWRPHRPTDLDHLGFGKLPNVITNVELEEMARKGKITRPSDGKEVSSVAFIQYTGSTDENLLSYGAAVTCMAMLKQALYVREQSEANKAYVIYDHLRTPGQHEEFYRRVQEDTGVFLTKGKAASVAEAGGAMTLTIEDSMLGETVQVQVDLIVIATGMVPNAVDGEALRAAIDAKAAAERDNKPEEAAAAAEKLKTFPPSILHLDYRQGPDLPQLEYGFPDSHFICFAYETRRTGIYVAGAIREPMDSLDSMEDATGAALKAIQSVEMLSRGEAVHPRAGDLYFPDFFLQRCTQCKRCTEECPFGTLNEDTKGTPLVNITRCRRCGICLGSCPERIVNFGNYGIDQVASMIKAVNVPEEFEEKPRVLVLACENDAYPAIDVAGMHRLRYSPFVRIVPVRCLGSVNVIWVNEAVSRGFDGVLLLGCRYGKDYQCHFIRGSELADRRGENVREKLKQMALENERVQLHEVQISDWPKVPGIINDFMETIQRVGMNPFKGM